MKKWDADGAEYSEHRRRCVQRARMNPGAISDLRSSAFVRVPSIKIRQRWIILFGMAMLVMFAPLPTAATSPVERTFHIQASQFEYSPGTLAVNPGDHVTLELTATDVVHGLAIDGYNIETTADPGQTARLSFTADKQGSFRFRCTTTCGNLHPFMIGKINVGQNDLLLRAIVLSGLALFAGAWGLWK